MEQNQDIKQNLALYDDPEKLFRRLIEDIKEGVYIANAHGQLIYVNDTFVNILGFMNKTQLIGTNVNDQLHVTQKSKKDFLSHMKKTGFVRDYEVNAQDRGGNALVLLLTCSYVRNEKERIVGFEGTIHDVTNQRLINKKASLFSKVVEQTADHVMITDLKGQIEYVNLSFEEKTGYLLSEIKGKTPRVLKSGVHDKQYYEKLWDTILAGKNFYAHTTNKNKAGGYYVADQTISPICDQMGKITHFVSIWKDVTDEENLKARLRREKEKFEEIIGFDEKVSRIRKLDQLVDFVVDKTVKILDVRKCTIMLLDHYHQELCLKGIKGFSENEIINEKVDLKNQHIKDVILEGKSLLINDMTFSKHKNKKLFLSVPFMMVPIRLENRVIGLIAVSQKNNGEFNGFGAIDLKVLSAIAREVAVSIENVRLYKELHYFIVTDSLTQLHNFRYFKKNLQLEISRSIRFKRDLCLMLIDVDAFKQYNEIHGNKEGDELLRNIARIIERNLRDVDIICRYAGDEFAAILPETTAECAVFAAEKIVNEISKSILMKKVTVSVGLAEVKGKMESYDLIFKADRALSESKKNGKNKISVFR